MMMMEKYGRQSPPPCRCLRGAVTIRYVRLRPSGDVGGEMERDVASIYLNFVCVCVRARVYVLIKTV